MDASSFARDFHWVIVILLVAAALCGGAVVGLIWWLV